MSTSYTKDTTTFQNGSTFDIPLIVPRASIPAIPAGRKPMAVINNETGVSLNITLAGGRNFTLAAGAWTKPFVMYFNDTNLHGVVTNVLPNSPVNTFSITVYGPNEDAIQPVALGNSPIGISGNVQTSNVQSLTNDGSAPETTVIEMTPSDQTQSSIVERNTGSGFRQILSAGVLRTIWNFVRGNATTGKASIQFGDSGDPTISTYYGSIQGAQPANVGALTSAGQTVSGSINIANNSGWVKTTVNTLSANADVAEWVDGHSLADWFFIIQTNGDLILWDNKNGRSIWDAVLSAQQLNIPGILIAGSSSPVNTTTFEAAATNAQGNRVGLISNSTVTATDNCDLLDLQRTTTHIQTFTFGIAPDSTFYIFDVGNGAFAGQGIFGSGSSAGGGRICTMRSAGGGNAGQVIFEGTTDPGGNANEGDLWTGA